MSTESSGEAQGLSPWSENETGRGSTSAPETGAALSPPTPERGDVERAPADSAGGEAGPAPRRRRRGGRRRRGRAAGPGPGPGPGPGAEGADPSVDATSGSGSGSDLPPNDDDSPLDTHEGETPPDAPDAPASAGDGTRERRRRRGRRGRRGRSDAAPSAEAAAPGDVSASAANPGRATAERPAPQRARNERSDRNVQRESEADSAKRRRRGSRGGRRRRRGGREDERPFAQPARRPAGGPVGVELIPGEEDELPELLELPPDAELLDAPQAEPRERDRERARAEADPDYDPDAPMPENVVRDQVILVNATDPEEIRVAVVQDGRIVDLQMTVHRHQSLVNDIYRGRVVNIEEGIGAAFIDFGQGRNGFLHTSDVMSVYGDSEWSIEKLLTTKVGVEEWDEDSSQPDVGVEMGDNHEGRKGAPKEHHVDDPEDVEGGGRNHRRRARPRLPITELLRKGQLSVVQITKDAIGDKGPTLTTYISIPGRYLVLMPCLAKTGVSRKIDDEKERRRLRRILESMQIPHGMGVIVRTAGTGKTRLEIERDLKYLLAIWDNFEKRLKRGTNPTPLYQESDVAIRTMRDLFSSRTEKVVVDNHAVYEHMLEFTRELMPEHIDKIQIHEGQRPLFHTYGVEQDFEKIFARRVDLPSGGSIVLDQAEALVAIDVNSGRTREDGADFEDIALKTNLEAVSEITRQLKLRDLGGIIVIDFIDMMRAGSRRSVERALRDALSTDRARSKIGRISQFGLLELTRQRLGPGLSKLLYDSCPHCRGSGRMRTSESRAQAVLRRIASAISQKGFTAIDVHARPDIVELLTTGFAEHIQRLRDANPGKELRFTAVPDQMEDSIFRYLRADGREVRPGGRRRR